MSIIHIDHFRKCPQFLSPSKCINLSSQRDLEIGLLDFHFWYLWDQWFNAFQKRRSVNRNPRLNFSGNMFRCLFRLFDKVSSGQGLHSDLLKHSSSNGLSYEIKKKSAESQPMALSQILETTNRALTRGSGKTRSKLGNMT